MTIALKEQGLLYEINILYFLKFFYLNISIVLKMFSLQSIREPPNV